jgi:hypothetical protein
MPNPKAMTDLKHTLIRSVGGAAAGASVLTAIANLFPVAIPTAYLAWLGAVIAAATVGLATSGDLKNDDETEIVD